MAVRLKGEATKFRYPVQEALNQLQPLIRWTAHHFAVKTDFRRSWEDLEAEGNLELVKCCQSFPGTGLVEFRKYFKRCWYNRLKKLHRLSCLVKMRQGQEVDISEFEIPITPLYPVDYNLVQRVKALRPYLTEEAFRVLDVLANPSPEVYHEAWKDFCRRNKLKSQGKQVRKYSQFRVRSRHFSTVLGMTTSEMRGILRQLYPMRFPRTQRFPRLSGIYPKQQPQKGAV